MAVENKYVNTALNAGKNANALAICAAEEFVGIETFEIAAADSDGSVYRVFKNVNPDLIPVKIEIYNDAITLGSDFDLGLYAPLEKGGAEIDKDCFVDGADLSSGHAKGSPLNGLSTAKTALENVLQRIWEIAGDTQATKRTGYDIAFTGNTVGTGAGTVTIVAWFVQG